MLVRAQCTLHGKSGLPEDRYVNTFYFFKDQVTDANRIALAEDLTRFYGTPIAAGGGSYSLAGWLNGSAMRATNPLGIKMYDMSDLKPRVARYEGEFPLTMGTTQPFPQEVAICMSYRGNQVSGVPAARRRGRVYLGPLVGAAASGNFDSGESRPGNTVLATIPALGQRLGNEAEVDGFDWVVHSPTTGLDARYVIAEVGVDNSWDTQRRRGLAPTTKTWLPVGTP